MDQNDRDRIWESRAEHSANSFTLHPWRTAAKWFVGFLVAIFLLSVLSNVVGITSIYWGAEKAKITAKPRVTQRIYQTDNIVAQIAFFHDQCEQVNADAKIVNINAQRLVNDQKAARYATDPIRRQQAQDALQQDAADLAGVQGALERRAADYNSRSQQSTANVFKGHGLPRRIDVPSSPAELADFHVNCGPGR